MSTGMRRWGSVGRGTAVGLALGAVVGVSGCIGETSRTNPPDSFHSSFAEHQLLGELSSSEQETLCHERFDHYLSLLNSERFCLLSAKVSSFYALSGTTADGFVPDTAYQTMCTSKYSECIERQDELFAKYQLFSKERCDEAGLQIGCAATVAQMEACVRAEANTDEVLLATPCENSTFAEHSDDSPAKKHELSKCKEFRQSCFE